MPHSARKQKSARDAMHKHGKRIGRKKAAGRPTGRDEFGYGNAIGTYALHGGRGKSRTLAKRARRRAATSPQTGRRPDRDYHTFTRTWGF